MYTPRKLTLTLLLQALILFSTTEAHIHQRDHANLKRLLKKRAPADQPLVPVIGAAAAPKDDITTTSASTSASATITPNPSVTPSASGSASSSASASAGLSDLLNSLGLGSSTSSDASSTATSSTATSSSVSSTSSTESILVTSPPAQSTPTGVNTPSVSTRTTLVGAEETASNAPLASANASKPKSIALTVLIVVASSVAAITILWTVFRKWKFGRSAKFDERMNPINWQPTGADDEAIPGSHRRLSGASFQSGSAHGHPNSAGTGHGSDHGHGYTNHGTYGIPDHDFTAGASHLAPVGGYADLTRGPSPQPQMHQTGHSTTYGHYDANVPLHHQTGY
jgi:hypothetical protein